MEKPIYIIMQNDLEEKIERLKCQCNLITVCFVISVAFNILIILSFKI